MISFKLEADFTPDDVNKMVEDFLVSLRKVLKNELNQLGLEMLSDARLKTKPEGGFDDQTGNLRSSMFYTVAYDGQVLDEQFEASERGTDKSTGLSEGRKYADSLLDEHKEGWVIVIGAGMEYASYVEAKGYDVITGSTLGVQRKLQRALDNVKKAFR